MLSNFLIPAILMLQRNKINQSLYYAVNLIEQQDVITINEEYCEDEYAESSQVTIDQLIEAKGHDNVKEIWAVRVKNSQIAKHHVILLKNDTHIFLSHD